jgi:nucleotidyltransferase/DNA polymerase involved in DNA repair
MPKRRPSRTALRRRSRSEKRDFHEIVSVLERAGAPLSADELAQRLRVQRDERRVFDAALAARERRRNAVLLGRFLDTGWAHSFRMFWFRIAPPLPRWRNW